MLSVGTDNINPAPYTATSRGIIRRGIPIVPIVSNSKIVNRKEKHVHVQRANVTREHIRTHHIIFYGSR